MILLPKNGNANDTNYDFSIRAPTRGAIAGRQISISLRSKFQSTRLHEVRSSRWPNRTRASNFNPRTCTRCDVAVQRDDATAQNFNLRTCTRCDMALSMTTSCPLYFNPRTCTRCDRSRRPSGRLQCYFNPRTYTRCDSMTKDEPGRNERISIHAPTRGAMTKSPASTVMFSVFQSTHLHEVRSPPMSQDRVRASFQSTHLHEVR